MEFVPSFPNGFAPKQKFLLIEFQREIINGVRSLTKILYYINIVDRTLFN